MVCLRNVYNLEAIAELKPVAKLFRRTDGRILTSECDRGQRRRHARQVTKVLASLSMIVIAMLFIAERISRPVLAPEADPMKEVAVNVTTVRAKNVDGQLTAPMSSGVDEEDVEESTESAASRLKGWWPDEAAAILDNKDDPESEQLGTGARTERAVALRRDERNEMRALGVLKARAMLVSYNPADRFISAR